MALARSLDLHQVRLLWSTTTTILIRSPLALSMRARRGQVGGRDAMADEGKVRLTVGRFATYLAISAAIGALGGAALILAFDIMDTKGSLFSIWYPICGAVLGAAYFCVQCLVYLTRNGSRPIRTVGIVVMSILLSWAFFLLPPVIVWSQSSATPSDFWRQAANPLSNEIMLSGLVAGVAYGVMIAALYFLLRLSFNLISGVLRRERI